MLKSFVFVLLRFSLVPILREILQRRRVTVILYHSVDPDVLDRHLQALRRRYRFIALQDYLEARAAGSLDSLPPKAMVLTLDDGHAANYRLLPVLRKHEVAATVFVCTRIVGTHRHFWFRDEAARGEVGTLLGLPDEERRRRLAARGFEETREYAGRHALTWEEMGEMREWVDFQSHTRFHPLLVRCPEDRARDEIRGSRTDLEERG
jgi:peptidoglycan/xylan/chitin deacetylase (PgdA/CDA1 family)